MICFSFCHFDGTNSDPACVITAAQKCSKGFCATIVLFESPGIACRLHEIHCVARVLKQGIHAWLVWFEEGVKSDTTVCFCLYSYSSSIPLDNPYLRRVPDHQKGWNSELQPAARLRDTVESSLYKSSPKYLLRVEKPLRFHAFLYRVSILRGDQTMLKELLYPLCSIEIWNSEGEKTRSLSIKIRIKVLSWYSRPKCLREEQKGSCCLSIHNSA